MKLYSKDFKTTRTAQAFSPKSPIWERKDRESLPFISGESDDQADIQSYEDTSMKAIFARLLPEEQVSYFLGKSAPVQFTSDYVNAGERYEDELEELNSMLDYAEELREKYNLPMTMTPHEIFNTIKERAEESLQRNGHIRKNFEYRDPAGRPARPDSDNNQNDEKPVAEDNGAKGGDEK